MSGICGIFNLNGAPVTRSEIQNMAATLQRRGPDETGTWHQGSVGLGHTMLRTTPESLHEHPPVVNRQGDLFITADVRLDNRDELIDVLGLVNSPPEEIGDQALILCAYERWGRECPTKLLGAFAFAVWDKRDQTLFCARDHFGIKPFIYHHSPRRFFTFASAPRAMLALPQTPYRINEARIADFLITQLEGIDKTSTFFEKIYRLPPAHTLMVTRQGVRLQRYWTLEPAAELRLSSDEEYAEAFLDIFTRAVCCRLRGTGPVGSMLSGGMDSGAIVAVASALQAEAGQGPFPTFSAVAPHRADCIETRTIYAAQTMDGLDPHIVAHGQWDQLLSDLQEQTWDLDEPFDGHMTLVRAIYLDARRHGVNVVLDGIDGDTVLSEGTHIARLLRRGRWMTAYREAVGQNRFWRGGYPPTSYLYRSAIQAFAPKQMPRLHRLRHSCSSKARVENNIRTSIINPDFAQRIFLAERLERLDSHRQPQRRQSLPVERAAAVDHPYLTVGVERYNRVASSLGVEPRHPFLDRRLVDFCLSLPGEQKLGQGWPKIILRRAMAGRLPEEVRWRRGKEHLGWAFTVDLMSTMQTRVRSIIDDNMDLLSKYVHEEKIREICRSYFEQGDPTQEETVYEAAHLAAWLSRPIGPTSFVTKSS